jgi:tripeptide aminopeptidase
MNQTALERFLRYAKIDTQSKEDSETYPSTLKQFELARLLVSELKELGLDASVDDYCYVMATLPSNVPQGHPAYGKVPPVAFIAHVDTSPEVTAENVNPQVFTYEGGDIVLKNDTSVVITAAENPGLGKCIGHTLVVTDGTTLLGSDNKSGIAAIMTAAQYLLNNPEIIHGDIRICFTPDEEVGQGTKHIDLSKLNAKYAYTVDGDLPGELNKETFSANACIVTVHGRDIHPGFAKDIMVNSVRVMADIIARMPRDMAPETTDGYQPYIHPYVIEGGIAKSTLKILFRDFETPGLDDLKKIMENIVAEVQPLHPRARIEMEIKEQYRNMRDKLIEQPEVLENLWEAAVRSGIEPVWTPIRGGTDGSRLTEMGLPCPNIYTGGQNFHSRTEWLSVDFMDKAVETVVNLAQIWVEKTK